MKKIIVKYNNMLLDVSYRIRTPTTSDRIQFCGNCVLSRFTHLKDGCRYSKMHQFFMNQEVINHYIE